MSDPVTTGKVFVNVDQSYITINSVGEQGIQGPVGPGVAPGGATNAVLVKTNASNYATEWTNEPTLKAVQLDLDNNVTATAGILTWNIDERTADLGRGNDVVLQLGEELHYPMARNAEATTLTNGTIVMVDPAQPAQGQRLRVKRFISDGTYPADLFVGMVTEPILPNEIGIITWFGQVQGLSLPALQPVGETWAEGDILWPNPAVAGGLTKVEPTAPALKISVAAILRISGNNINVLVRPNLRSKLADLHDVEFTNVQTNQVLTWNGTAWVNANNEADGVLSVTGDGVGGTATNVVMTFPAINQIGAYSNTNPANYINVAQSIAAAPVQSVNGQTNVVVLTKSNVGLSNVDNTSDLDKPISNATQTALNLKYDASNPSNFINAAGAPIQTVTGTLVTGTSANPVVNIPTLNQVGAYSNTNPSNFINVAQAAAAAPVQSVAGRTGNVVLTKTDVGLANVDNTSDLNKPISTATQTALNLKANIAGDTFTGNVTVNANVAVSQSITEAGFRVVTQQDIGSAPNEVPLNQYLGDLAYLGTQDVTNIVETVPLSNVTITDSGSINGAYGTLPTADNNSVSTSLVAWGKFKKMLQRGAEGGTLYSRPLVSTYSLVYTAVNAYIGGVLAPNGDIQFVPHSGNRGQKINISGIVSTYSLVYTTAEAYTGGVLATNGDIHFVPASAVVGQKIDINGIVSTYSLVYTTSTAYWGGVLAPNGDIHFVPFNAVVGQKIDTSGVVSTYSLVYTTSSAYMGGVLAPNGDIHFIPRNANRGQKINAAGVVSTYSLVYTASNAYTGGVLAPNGDIHFVPLSANRGQKIDINGVVSTYSLVYTTTFSYIGGVLAPNGDIHFVPNSAVIGQKIDINGIVSTYSLIYTLSGAYRGGVLMPNGDIYFVPLSADRGQILHSQYGEGFTRGVCMSPHLNKF